jgi:uncharacterized DUF497 family protein
MSLLFEWDRRKASANARKHGIFFEEATSVFDDPLAKIFVDEWHSQGEAREIIIGHSAAEQLLLVVFTERAEGQIRIVSARRATLNELRDYEQHP